MKVLHFVCEPNLLFNMQQNRSEEFVSILQKQPGDSDGNAISPEIFRLLECSLNPEMKVRLAACFLAGNVFNKDYTDEDRWRDEISEAVERGGFVPVDGVNMKMYERNVYAAAGMSMFQLGVAPIMIANATRGHHLCPATHVEAELMLASGGNIGFWVDVDDYESVVKYIRNPVESEHPSVLPAWWGTFDLQPEDIICGKDDIPRWLAEQKRLLTSINTKLIRAFRGRTPNRYMAHVLHFLRTYSANDKKTLDTTRRILALLN